MIQEEYVVFQSLSFSHLTVIDPTENPPNIHFLLEIVFSSQYDIVGQGTLGSFVVAFGRLLGTKLGGVLL